ncbi:hypothetical protein FKP32DRAFT_1016061 [Trametes sanguinea]|nr:hypothetical protein FKP32DRAFT_1016061 [Trametes sanguinea]
MDSELARFTPGGSVATAWAQRALICALLCREWHLHAYRLPFPAVNENLRINATSCLTPAIFGRTACVLIPGLPQQCSTSRPRPCDGVASCRLLSAWAVLSNFSAMAWLLWLLTGGTPPKSNIMISAERGVWFSLLQGAETLTWMSTR